MMSILGATPDDMEEILKGLGYRADVASPEDVARIDETETNIFRVILCADCIHNPLLELLSF
jgi:hypothetical protein